MLKLAAQIFLKQDAQDVFIIIFEINNYNIHAQEYVNTCAYRIVQTQRDFGQK